MARKTLKNGEWVNDPYGDIDAEMSENESPNETHYRNWKEQNKALEENGYYPKPYEPLEED